MGFPGGPVDKEFASPWRRHRRYSSEPWLRKILWRRKWPPTPVFLPGKFHGQRSLEGYSPWGRKESDTTEHTHKHWTAKGLREIFLDCLSVRACSASKIQRHQLQKQHDIDGWHFTRLHKINEGTHEGRSSGHDTLTFLTTQQLENISCLLYLQLNLSSRWTSNTVGFLHNRESNAYS